MKCEIIHYLPPLYCDGLCSEASKQEIEPMRHNARNAAPFWRK